MATHSSILAWKIPWTEDPGRLQFVGRKGSDTTEQLMLSLFHCLPKTQINIVIDSENQMTWSQSSRVYSGIGETAVTQAKRNQEEFQTLFP